MEVKYSFDDAQQQALSNLEGVCVYEGCSGSGKSTLILHRSEQMKEQLGFESSRILILCATDTAMKQMQMKYRMMNDEGMPIITTMNRFCTNLLVAYEQKAGIPARKLFTSLNKTVHRIVLDTFGVYLNDVRLKEICDALARVRAEMLGSGDIAKIQFEKIDFSYLIELYQKYKMKQEIRDIDDVKASFYEMLLTQPVFNDMIASKFEAVMVDDAQHLSLVEHLILKQVVSKHGNLFVAYDLANPINKKRGAYPQALEAYASTYQDVAVVKNNCNYRTPANICELLTKIDVKTGDANNKNTDNVAFKALKDKADLGDYIIKNYDESKKTVVLASSNATLLEVMDRLIDENVPFQMRVNMNNFFKSELASTFISVMKLMKNPYDSEAFKNVFDKLDLDITETQKRNTLELMHLNPSLDVYQAYIQTINKQAQRTKLVTRLEKIRMAFEMNSYRLVDFILAESGFGTFLTKAKIAHNDEVIETIRVFSRRYPKFEEMIKRLDYLKTYEPSLSANLILSTPIFMVGDDADVLYLADCISGMFPRNEECADEKAMFANMMQRACEHLELIAYRSICLRRVKVSPFMYKLCAKEDDNEAEANETTKVEAVRLRRGMKILHKQFGVGTIKAVGDGKIKVAFAEGEKVLSELHCRKKQMIEIL